MNRNTNKIPDRYTGCGFCGKMIQHSSFCWSCERHFEKWLFDLFYNKNKRSKSTTNYSATKSDNETNDWKLWCNISQGCHRFVSAYSYKHRFPVREFVEPKMDEPWKGFNIGDKPDEYVVIDPFELKSKICFDDIGKIDGKTFMLRELEKNGIDPYSVIKIDKSSDLLKERIKV